MDFQTGWFLVQLAMLVVSLVLVGWAVTTTVKYHQDKRREIDGKDRTNPEGK